MSLRSQDLRLITHPSVVMWSPKFLQGSGMLRLASGAGVCLYFTCTTDENGAAQCHAGSLARVDPHRQRFYQSPLLKRDVIRQPGLLKFSHKDRKGRRMTARLAMLHKSLQRSDSCWATCGSKTNALTCSRSWRCVCSIDKGFHHQGVWHRRRWSEKGCISQFWSTHPSPAGHQARWPLCLLKSEFAHSN